MPYWRSFAHLVWTTKGREPLITPQIEGSLYATIVSKAAELDCYVHAINGMLDHVHLIISIPPKHSVAWVVKNLKGNSSHFVNHVLTTGEKPFSWQHGYGYLSLGESQCERAIAYVTNQKQHHAAMTTNSWLEKVNDDDEGDQLPQSPTVREQRLDYDLPF